MTNMTDTSHEMNIEWTKVVGHVISQKFNNDMSKAQDRNRISQGVLIYRQHKIKRRSFEVRI